MENCLNNKTPDFTNFSTDLVEIFLDTVALTLTNWISVTT